jgi:GNAT superfamily N-acetyltransferase
MRIIEAQPEDAAALTEIAFQAKRHWGYAESWMRRWQEALTVTADYIVEKPTFVAVDGGNRVGFCALQIKEAEALLDHLWVLPASMRRGAGRALFEHAEAVARARGAVRLTMVGDPHAEGFYCRMGATVYGREAASMDGTERFLPLLEKRCESSLVVYMHMEPAG